MIEVGNSCRLPGSLIMRQQASGHIGTLLTEEYEVLHAIDRSGVPMPVPTPIHYEREETALGGSFLLMRRLHGQVMGDYEGFHIRSEPALDDLAIALARLHAIDPAAIGLPDAMPGEDCGTRLRRANDRAWARWRDHAVEPSPLVEFTFAWIDRQSRSLDFPAGCVHGDMRPHNLLASPDGLTGILDWELFHLGDTAEDLAYLRPTVEKLGLWERFIARYESAGGRRPDENRLRLHAAAGSVRNASFSAVSAHLHISGEVQDFVRGASGYYSLPLMERQLVDILEGVLT
jgi:aminoglycoside phosphotransferase (APT) family kinase protein